MRQSRGVLLVLVACSSDPTAPAPQDGHEDTTSPTPSARGIDATSLVVDVTALTGTASITFEPSANPGATLEIGDLAIESVREAGNDLEFAPGVTPNTIDLALPPSTMPRTVDITYRYRHHANGEGAHSTGYTLTWPYFCGNLFPCHSRPDDGAELSLSLSGVPTGKVAVYPTTIAEAPSYQLAWSIDDYVETSLGTTTDGTSVSVWHRPTELATAQAGTEHLRAVFDWLEQTIGSYRFGTQVGTVSVRWGAGAFGGMEHHPLWHVGSAALASDETNAHEAVHGWFGDGVRIACWEDFVLSEGTTTYLAARALSAVAPTVGAATWDSYAADLAQIDASDPVWPDSCNSIDILRDNLFTRAPYVRGAFFYRAVALRVGEAKVDEALAAFYRAHGGTAARMSDMLQTIATVTGFDPASCAQAWLRSPTIPAIGPCP